ncbi:MAG: HAD-IA family hydrolase [Pseudomonadota bacterium]
MADFLALFDVDGTLVDSQAVIVDTMTAAFKKAQVPPPERHAVLHLVGLSLPRIIATLAEGQSEATVNDIIAHYRLGFANAMEEGGEPPLYPGVSDGLQRLAQGGVQLGLATGKSKRGLDRLVDAYGWRDMFATMQFADFHPSKPHPSMVRRALLETASEEDRCVVIGDTTFDIEMAKAADVAAIGVTWGYHPAAALQGAGAVHIAETFDALVDHVLEMAA